MTAAAKKAPPASRRIAGEPSGFHAIGQSFFEIAETAGGMGILFGRVLSRIFTLRLDGAELMRNLYKMGFKSMPIVIVTALFTGAIMVIQAAPLVQRFGAYGLLGWGAGFGTLREVAPLLTALMINGRVGANNTAELGTMTVTEQLDGLRALAIDPIRYLIVPRVLAMLVMLTALTIIGDLVALVGASLVALLVLDIDWRTMYGSFADNLTPQDFFHGVQKSVAFGAAIALTSCYFGVTVKGGAVGVGRAVNAAVVAAAVSIMLLDFFITYASG